MFVVMGPRGFTHQHNISEVTNEYILFNIPTLTSDIYNIVVYRRQCVMSASTLVTQMEAKHFKLFQDDWDNCQIVQFLPNMFSILFIIQEN